MKTYHETNRPHCRRQLKEWTVGGVGERKNGESGTSVLFKVLQKDEGNGRKKPSWSPHVKTGTPWVRLYHDEDPFTERKTVCPMYSDRGWEEWKKDESHILRTSMSTIDRYSFPIPIISPWCLLRTQELLNHLNGLEVRRTYLQDLTDTMLFIYLFGYIYQYTYIYTHTHTRTHTVFIIHKTIERPITEIHLKFLFSFVIFGWGNDSRFVTHPPE